MKKYLLCGEVDYEGYNVLAIYDNKEDVLSLIKKLEKKKEKNGCHVPDSSWLHDSYSIREVGVNLKLSDITSKKFRYDI